MSLPLFDGGQRAANVTSAEANYTQAVATYRDKVRQAVREVEEGLASLVGLEDARRSSLAAQSAQLNPSPGARRRHHLQPQR